MNQNLKQNAHDHIDRHVREFITLYNPINRNKRKETYNIETNPEGNGRKLTHDEIIARDKTSLDII